MVKNPVKPRLNRSRKNLDNYDKIDLEKQTLSYSHQKRQLYTVGKICRIKQKTKASKKRKRLLGVRRQLVNNVDTGINL